MGKRRKPSPARQRQCDPEEENGRKLPTAAAAAAAAAVGRGETQELKEEAVPSGQGHCNIFLNDRYCLYVELLLLQPCV